MKRRNTENGKYYVISNPIWKNERTGNFCIQKQNVLAYDKDFLFEYEHPITHEVERKVLPKEYVKEHITWMPRWVEDELTLTKEIRGSFYLITYEDIERYAA